MLTNRAGKQVAAYIHTDVTKYKDLLALFALAEKTFGGVDVIKLFITLKRLHKKNSFNFMFFVKDCCTQRRCNRTGSWRNFYTS